MLGVLLEGLGEFDAALQSTERSVEIARSLDDRRCLGRCLLMLADVIDEIGDRERAEPLFNESAELLRETGEQGWLVSALTNLALIVHIRGDTALAEQHAAAALESAVRIGYTWGTALSLSRQGLVAFGSGDYQRAIALFQQSLKLWEATGERWRVALTLSHLADAAAAVGELDRAARVLGSADALGEQLAVSPQLTDSEGWHRARRVVTEQLDAEDYTRLWSAGHALSWDAMIAEATTPFSFDDAGPRPAAAGEPIKPLLSPRESEVLQLLVEGHSDREIAAALFISPRTAQGHVANIFNKLGVNSRTAAATVALVAGLVPPPDVPAA